MSVTQSSFKIAIVGLGPKGLYGLERLLANLNGLKKALPLEIHLFNKSHSFGAGDIYNPSQPDFLLMNYVNGYINMWPKQDPHPIVSDPKSFVEWLGENNKEYQNVSAETVSSRATVGKYLAQGFDELIAACPDHVSIRKHIGEVTDLQEEEGGYTISFRGIESKVDKIVGLDKVLIATGHPCVNNKSHTSKAAYIDFIYPVVSRLSAIQAGDSVAVKGLGLTFIDAVLALTEGRDGSFEEQRDGKLVYKPSGLEPAVILPFSNSGLPMIPRGNTFETLIYSPYYFTNESLKELRTFRGKYDFEKQLLPLIEKEFKLVYYSGLFSEKGMHLEYDVDYNAVHSQIDLFHKEFPSFISFDMETFLTQPFAPTGLICDKAEYLSFCIEQAQIGESQSAFAAVAGLWRQLSTVFNDVYKFGGFTPESQKLFREKYAGHLNRVSYGPPIQNMKKIEALTKAALIDFSFAKSPKILDQDKTTLSIAVEGKHAEVDFLVDARIPKVQLHKCQSEFYANLLDKEMVKPYVNQLEWQEDFTPGCVAINEKGHPLDKFGMASDSITFTGTPTEGLTYDNDTLSRERNDFVSNWAIEVIKDLEASYSHPIQKTTCP